METLKYYINIYIIEMVEQVDKDLALTFIAMVVVVTVCAIYGFYGVDTEIPELLNWLITILMGWLLGVGGIEKAVKVLKTQ